jgi:hypothetical protein
MYSMYILHFFIFLYYLLVFMRSLIFLYGFFYILYGMIQRTIWDSIEDTQSIFVEKDVFTIDYVPEAIKYRDKQIEKIIYNLKIV